MGLTLKNKDAGSRETKPRTRKASEAAVEVRVHKIDRSKPTAAPTSEASIDQVAYAKWKHDLFAKYASALQKLKQQWKVDTKQPSRTAPYVASRQRCYLVVVPYGIPQRHTISLYPIGQGNERVGSKTFDHNLHISPQSELPAIRFGSPTMVTVDDFRLSKHRKTKVDDWSDPATLYAKWIATAGIPDLEGHRPNILRALAQSIRELKTKEAELLFDVYLLTMPALEPVLVIPTFDEYYVPCNGGGVRKPASTDAFLTLGADMKLDTCSTLELDCEFKPMTPAT